jgi:hypothetical protein
VRVESPGFIEDFLRNGNEDLVQYGAHLPEKQGQSSFDERLEVAIKESAAVDGALLSRLAKLLKVWSERRVFVGVKNLGYYAGFGSTHRDITQREYEEIIGGYLESRDRGALEAQLVEHAARVASPQSDVAQEFLRIVVEARGEDLEQAADAELESDTAELLARAHECLELVGGVLERPTPLFALTSAFSRMLVQGIAGQAFKWIHFNVPVYQQSRQEEKQLLLALARESLLSGFDWLDLLLPWTDRTLHFSDEGQKAAAELIDELLRSVQGRVTTEALELFARESAHLQFYTAKATGATRFCFFDPNSPLWQDAGRVQFFGVLESANRSRALRQNASELLACLSWTRARAGFAGNPDELKRILLLPGVAKALWAASTAQRIHYRFQQRLIETRRAILKIGIDEDQLPVPEWLAGRVKELGGLPSDPSIAAAAQEM